VVNTLSHRTGITLAQVVLLIFIVGDWLVAWHLPGGI
jgi:hypothetical protein